jgi:hypothetical protein
VPVAALCLARVVSSWGWAQAKQKAGGRMMALQKKRYTPEEYLKLEKHSEERYEFFDCVCMMQS